MEGYLPLIFALLAAGVVSGFLAGLMGIGGGIVIIPALITVFDLLGYEQRWIMHMAVGTSLAIIVATSIASVKAHNKKGAVDWSLIKRWWVWIAVGAVSGAFFAKTLKTEELIYFFVVLIAMLALKMILPLDNKRLGSEVPSGIVGVVPPSVIGFFSSIMGIGGGSFTVPFLTLYAIPIHRAVGTAAMGGMAISIAGGLGFVISGFDVEGLPQGNVGFINMPAALIMALASVLMAPVGAATAHKLPKRALSIIFGVFLFIAAVRLYTAL